MINNYKEDETLAEIEDKLRIGIENINEEEVKFLLEYIYLLKNDNDILFNMVTTDSYEMN